MSPENRFKARADKPTIVIFSTAYLPFLGGAETAIKGITDELGDFNFVMFTARMSRALAREEIIGNVWVYRLGFGAKIDKFFLPIFACIKFFSMRKNFSGAVMLWGVMISYASIAALFIKYLNHALPILVTVQEGDSEDYILHGKGGLIRFFWKRLLSRADYIQVISNHLEKLCRKMGAGALIAVIPNGVDIQRFSNPDGIAMEDIKSGLLLKGGDPIVISVSRLALKNGMDILVKSMQFTRTVPILVVIGDGEEREHIIALRDSLGLKDRIHFALSRPNEDVPNYLGLAKVFARPSRSEGLGTSFLEAMAAGVPIIATAVGGIKDFLKDKETGLEVRVDDPEDLAEKIDRLLTDEPLRQKLIANGKKLVEEKYQWSKIAADMRQIFLLLLSK